MKSKINALFLVFALVITSVFTLSGCNSNNSDNNTTSADTGNKVQYNEPTDNDYEGWFSVEVLLQYSAAGFAQPENTEVVSKPERDTLYLKGGEDTFKNTVNLAYSSIAPVNRATYLPVITLDENGVAEVSGLKEISRIDTSKLYPQGEDTSVTFMYLSGHILYECSISLETSADGEDKLVCVSLKDRTELYGDLV